MNGYRTIDISAWTKVGEGGNGSVYVNSSEPDVILKVNKPALSTEAFVRHEFEVSKAYVGQEEDPVAFDHRARCFAAMDLVVRCGFVTPSLLEKIFFSVMLRRIIKDCNYSGS